MSELSTAPSPSPSHTGRLGATAVSHDAAARRADALTIGLVGLAHGSSHFFHLLLPPLFPVLSREFNLSYSELGMLVTVFFAVSGVGQASSGFLVDKVGARPVLFAALGCFVLAALVASAAGGYGGLALAAALAGLGNAPFHPVDFTILNKRISPSRLGHAYAVHGIAGNLGWAVAPVFAAALVAVSGSWRIACLGAAVLAAVVLLVLVLARKSIDDRVGQGDAATAPGSAPQPAARGARRPLSGDAQRLHAEHPMAFLKLGAVWLCFGYFFWTTAALAAVQSFAGPALQQLYGLPLAVTAFVVTAYMLCGAAGMLAGGFIATSTERLERTIGWSMTAAASLLFAAGTGWLPGLAAAGAAALAGFGTGLAGPSRDMLIKRATPPNATGRVYGTVYSGLDLGFALAAPVFGALLDRGHAAGVFYGAALLLMLGVATAALVGARIGRNAVRTAAA